MPDVEPDAPNNSEEPDREPLVQYEDLEQATGFTQVSNAVLRCYPELSDGEKMTYAVLKSFAYVGPETFVGQETLARARAITVSTVSRHLNRLIDVGLVRVRRRGQGKTNIWIITRIPREKLERYIEDWRPKLHRRNAQNRTSQNAQNQTCGNPQVKTSQNPQAEEDESENTSRKNTNRVGDGNPPSTGTKLDDTTAPPAPERSYSLLPRIVENFRGADAELSTMVESVENLADLAADYFDVPDERRSIRGFLTQYDAQVVAEALDTVAARLEADEPINKPVAYFYTVVKVLQAEADVRAVDSEIDEQERRTIALNWARSLVREWPVDQVRAILADTYHSPTFADEVLDELLGDRPEM